MNQSENNTADKILENVFPVTHGIIGIGWHQIGDEQHEDFITAMETYANLRTASLIQTIENRIAELETQNEVNDYIGNTNHAVIAAFKGLLTLIKS